MTTIGTVLPDSVANDVKTAVADGLTRTVVDVPDWTMMDVSTGAVEDCESADVAPRLGGWTPLSLVSPAEGEELRLSLGTGDALIVPSDLEPEG